MIFCREREREKHSQNGNAKERKEVRARHRQRLTFVNPALKLFLFSAEILFRQKLTVSPSLVTTGGVLNVSVCGL